MSTLNARLNKLERKAAASGGAEHQAVVRSVTVDVEVLRIGARQMTLSVFKQLMVLSPFVDNDMRDQLKGNGELWGWVNYLVKHGNSERSWWLVWSGYGGKLFRCPLPSMELAAKWKLNQLFIAT
jgi:hypothetical protein